MLKRIMKRALIENRADDNRETALARMATYAEQSEPTLEWLKDSRVPIVELDCNGSVDEVWSQLLAIGRLMRGAVAVRSSVRPKDA